MLLASSIVDLHIYTRPDGFPCSSSAETMAVILDAFGILHQQDPHGNGERRGGDAAWGVSVEIEKYENKLRGLRDFLFDAERKLAH